VHLFLVSSVFPTTRGGECNFGGLCGPFRRVGATGQELSGTIPGHARRVRSCDHRSACGHRKAGAAAVERTHEGGTAARPRKRRTAGSSTRSGGHVKRIRQLHRRGAKHFGCSVSASNPFSSKQGEWRNLQGIDIHNNNRKGRFRQYRMYDPDFHPLTYAHMMEEYIRHAEAKSLGPDGKPCTNSVRNAENAAHEGAVGTREC